MLTWLRDNTLSHWRRLMTTLMRLIYLLSFISFWSMTLICLVLTEIVIACWILCDLSSTNFVFAAYFLQIADWRSWRCNVWTTRIFWCFCCRLHLDLNGLTRLLILWLLLAFLLSIHKVTISRSTALTTNRWISLGIHRHGNTCITVLGLLLSLSTWAADKLGLVWVLTSALHGADFGQVWSGVGSRLLPLDVNLMHGGIFPLVTSWNPCLHARAADHMPSCRRAWRLSSYVWLATSWRIVLDFESFGGLFGSYLLCAFVGCVIVGRAAFTTLTNSLSLILLFAIGIHLIN